MGDQLTTWDELRRDAEGAHQSAHAAYAAIADDLMHGGKRSDAFYGLTEAFVAATDALARLSRLAAESQPPASPARPLEAVLAAIEARGHAAWTVTRYPSGTMRIESYRDDRAQPAAGAPREAWTEWRAAAEQGEAWNMSLSVSSVDAAPLAEVRLAQIPEPHAEKLAKDGLAAVVPDDVKRFALDALAANARVLHAAPLLPPEAIAQAREHEAFWAAVDAEMENAGPEEIDSEHAAFVWAGFLTGLMDEDPETFDVRAVDDEPLPEHERLGRADAERVSRASEP